MKDENEAIRADEFVARRSSLPLFPLVTGPVRCSEIIIFSLRGD